MDDPDGNGKEEHGDHRLCTVPGYPKERDRVEPAQGFPEIPEKFPVQEPEDDGGDRRDHEDTGETDDKIHFLEPVFKSQGKEEYDKSVPDITNHHTKKDREKDREDRGRVHLTVPGRRDELHDKLEGFYPPRVIVKDRGLL